MIISHKHKFIFIKTRKTAGTSVEIALSEFCGSEDIITPISSEDEKARKNLGYRGSQNYYVQKHFHTRKRWYLSSLYGGKKQFYNHIPASQIKKYIDSKIWNEYYKFTIERHPVEKSISLYNYLGGFDKFGDINSFIKAGMLESVVDFDKYTKGGNIETDIVLQYSELHKGLKDLGVRLNLNKELSLPDYRAKGGFRKIADPIHLQLNSESKDILKLAFAREIKAFGYSIA